MTRAEHHLSPRARALVIAALRRRDGDHCAYCKVRMLFIATKRWVPAKVSIEHSVPIERGGSNDWDNVVLCCMRCNVRKGSKTAAEFLDVLDAERILNGA